MLKKYCAYEGKWFSWRGIKYYLKNRKELSKETLAQVLTTRDDTAFSSQSIFRTIESCLRGAYTIKRNGTDLIQATPLTKLQPGDLIWCPEIMCCRYWEYDGKTAKFLGVK